MATISSTRKRLSQSNLLGIMKITKETRDLPAVEHGNEVNSGVPTCVMFYE